MKIKKILSFLEQHAPLALQESYDNSGLLIGDSDEEIKGLLITVDVTEEVVEEAISKGCNLIVAHHPVIFTGLKSITGKNFVERVAIKAIKNDIAIYAVHTNLDSVYNGVSKMICDRVGLKNLKILDPRDNLLKKIVVYCPVDYADKVRDAIFSAGGGVVGEYDNCSFISNGKGSFRAGEGTDPFVGAKNKLHKENEVKIEIIFPDYSRNAVIAAMADAHPYEEVAYDILSLENKFDKVGFGMIGELPEEQEVDCFLSFLKEKMKTNCIRYNNAKGKKIKKVAVCGGAGSFLINKALSKKADVFITGDIKYHEFFEAEDKMVIADIGHFESEQFTKELLYRLISEKFSNFALNLSGINTNPVKYL
ncbi:MAG: Nif3-like dinuclear metal center hexameric protein [Bacteroidota bacterium]|nr:Nif3-like dinuclear metal center hexameric protein [Bacteroidota bacterium]